MILVTGATGLVGSYLTRQLLQRGYPVRGLRRATSDLRLLGSAANQVEWIEGDVTDIFSLQAAMLGVAQVYHCAALISMQPRDLDRMIRVNVEGTANLVNTAIEAGVQRLLYVSSVAAFGRPEGADRVIDEQLDVKDSTDNFAYYKSKLYAEREVWRGIAEGLPAVIINPATILGGGHFSTTPNNIFDQIYKGLPFYTTGSNGWVDVRDVVAIAIRLMESNIVAEKFIVSAQNASFKDILFAIADALHRPRPYLEAGPILGAVAWRLAAVQSLFSSAAPLITSDSATIAQLSMRYSSAKVEETLGYEFRDIYSTITEVAALYLAALARGEDYAIWE